VGEEEHDKKIAEENQKMIDKINKKEEKKAAL
jgi:hypothetical protein